MNSIEPCQQWADQLLTGATNTLSPSDYLLLKEHLLNCPYCMQVHRSYLGIEAQLHNLPLLQPQRQLSAQLLLAAEARRRKRHSLLTTIASFGGVKYATYGRLNAGLYPCG